MRSITNTNNHNKDSLPESVESTVLVTYRSVGLGLYGAIMRYAGMPLEKIALFMNSSQVSGKNQLRQAIQLTFQDGQQRSFLAPYKVVGPASGVAWFLQYSVMGKMTIRVQRMKKDMSTPEKENGHCHSLFYFWFITIFFISFF